MASLAAAVALLGACGKGDDAPPPPPPKKEGRAETQSIRNTEAVGYGGKAIANKIDDALNKSEQDRKKVEQQSTEQNPDAP